MRETLNRVTIDAPAKLNLGIEVLGRRPDGYHDIATIYVTVSLSDHLRLTDAPGLQVLCDQPNLAESDNLVTHALQAMRARSPGQGAKIEISKRIPVAAGLGGASSDAAAALVGIRELWELQMTDRELAAIAGELGSDVPFLLQGGCALGRGRGERLEQLPPPIDARFVVVVPTHTIHRKTATLYAALTTSDFSDGARVAAQAERFRDCQPIDPALLGNGFSRALYTLLPDLASLPEVIRLSGAPSVAISGAGPAHYAVFADSQQADHVAARLRQRLRSRAHVFVVSPVPARAAVSAAPTM